MAQRGALRLEPQFTQNSPSAGVRPPQAQQSAIPSNADLMTTQQLTAILRSVGVELLDHLIFTDDDMVSLRDSGLFSG